MGTVEDALRARGFDSLFFGNPDSTFVFDLTGHFVRWNDKLPTLTGYSDFELATVAPEILIDKDEQDAATREFEAVMAGETRRFVTRGTSRLGREYVLDVTNVPLLDDDGSVIAVFGIARDVSGFRLTVPDLERSDRFLRATAHVSAIGGWTIDAATGDLTTSEETAGLVSVTTAHDRHYSQRLSHYQEPHRTRLISAIETSLSAGTELEIECALTTASGDRRNVRIVGHPARLPDGSVSQLTAAVYDLSELLEAEVTAAQLEGLLLSTLDQVAGALYFLNREWELTFLNAMAVSYIGDSVGLKIWEVAPGAWTGEFGVGYRRAMDEQIVSTAMQYFPSVDGWFEATVYPTDAGIAVHVADVTEAQQARIELDAAASRVREQAALLDAAHDAIFVRQLDHRVTYWNRGAERLYGWTADEIIGRSTREVMYSDPTAFDAAQAHLLRTGQWIGELEQVTKDGRAIIADCRWQLELDEEGAPSFVLCVNSDITDYVKEVENSYREQRLESLGTLAGGLAHDLNNVLTPILMASSLLESDEADHERTLLLRSITTSANRGAEMIRQVLAFARGHAGAKSIVSIDRLFDDVRAICRDLLPKSIDVSVCDEECSRAFVGDGTQILQVIINLVTNARDAMPSGGSLSITATEFEHTDGSSCILITVEDSGAGMPPDIVAHVFEPFFTTKDIGAGTGLGLSTSLSIARNHGGDLSVVSTMGSGSRFELRLPAVPAPSAPTGAWSARVETRDFASTVVLAVDDERDIRDLVRHTLEAHGCRVLLASDGNQAVATLDRFASEIDVVITDMFMPTMGGEALAVLVREKYPAIRLIAASGLLSNEDVAREAHPNLGAFLAKPFDREALLDALQAATAH